MWQDNAWMPWSETLRSVVRDCSCTRYPFFSLSLLRGRHRPSMHDWWVYISRMQAMRVCDPRPGASRLRVLQADTWIHDLARGPRNGHILSLPQVLQGLRTTAVYAFPLRNNNVVPAFMLAGHGLPCLAHGLALSGPACQWPSDAWFHGLITSKWLMFEDLQIYE